MPDRTTHNMFNGWFFGFSGNDLHAYMDRASKELRQEHRTVGHDYTALMQMLIKFRNKYSPLQIYKTWMLHKWLDGIWSGFAKAVKDRNSGYGKKLDPMTIINNLKKEVFRYHLKKKV